MPHFSRKNPAEPKGSAGFLKYSSYFLKIQSNRKLSEVCIVSFLNDFAAACNAHVIELCKVSIPLGEGLGAIEECKVSLVDVGDHIAGENVEFLRLILGVGNAGGEVILSAVIVNCPSVEHLEEDLAAGICIHSSVHVQAGLTETVVGVHNHEPCGVNAVGVVENEIGELLLAIFVDEVDKAFYAPVVNFDTEGRSR